MFQRVLALLLMAGIVTTASAQDDPMTIADAKKQDFETKVRKVAGRVTVAGQFRNTCFLQDATAGIAVFNTAFRLGAKVGDSVIIENATLREFQPTTGQPGTGLGQLAGDSLTFIVVPTDPVDVRPRAMTIPLVTESIEAQLVRLRRVQFTETGKFQGERTYQVRDAFNNLMDVRIDGATEIATNFLDIPTGEIDLVGVVSQFRGTYQIQPRFAEDVGVTIEEDTVSPERTLDITTWNLYWFGSEDTTQGPSDKTRQAESIRRAMDSIGADMYAVQEVVGAAPLAALAAELEGTYTSLYTEEIPSTQKMAYIYNTKKLALLSSALAVNGGSQAWAGGRFPYRATFRADIQGQERTLHVFNIHGKATGDTTAYEDYERRKTDATTFHTYLQDFYADSIIAVVGDYNDDLTVSVIDELLVTPYVAFTEDTANWTAPTRTYGEEGLASYIGGDRSMVDHVMLSNELAPFHYRTKLETPNAYISSYTATTSDHLPVTARIWGGGTITSVNEVSMPLATLRIAPNPMSTHGAVELTLERTAAVRVSVVDAVGREVAVVLNETLEPQIRVLSLPVHDLGNGMYNVVVRMGADVSSTPMLVVR